MTSQLRGEIVALGRASRAGEDMESCAGIRLQAGRGIMGDRYAEGRGAWSLRPGDKRQLSLITAEAIEAASAEIGREIPWLAPRRNVVVRGVDLDATIGRRLRLGPVLVEVLSPAPPCDRLDRIVMPGLKAALRNRGGVYARILESGDLAPQDKVHLDDPRPPRRLP